MNGQNPKAKPSQTDNKEVLAIHTERSVSDNRVGKGALIMNNQRYLDRVYYLTQRVERLTSELNRWRDLSTKITTIITGLPKGQGFDTSTLENAVVKVVDLSDKLAGELNDVLEARNDVEWSIDHLVVNGNESDERYRVLMALRYLSFKSWEEIAKTMNLSSRRVQQLHNEAIIKIIIRTETTKES